MKVTMGWAQVAMGAALAVTVSGAAPVRAQGVARPILSTGKLALSERTLLMGIVANKKKGLDSEALRSYALEYLKKMRQRLLFAAAAEREGLAAAPAVLRGVEDFRVDLLAGTYSSEQRARLNTAGKASAAGGTKAEREKLARKSMEQAAKEFPAVVDEASLARAVRGEVAAETPVARVGGREIRFERVKPGLARVSHPSDSGGETEIKIARTVLDGLVAQMHFALLAEREGIGARPEVRDDVNDHLLRLLEREYEARVVVPAVTEADLQLLYGRSTERLRRGEERELFEILVADETSAGEILKRLRGGADFLAEARLHSKGPTREKGGALGFVAPGELIRELDEASAALGEGQIAGPIKTQYGYHLLRCARVSRGRVPPLDEVRPSLRRQLENERRTEALAAEVARLETQFALTVNESRLQEIMKGL